jgi:Ser/Thr protein kinase RdoA (MazF antagonist)
MTRPTYTQLDSVPDSLAGPWNAVAAITGSSLRLLSPFPGQSSWIAVTGDHVVYLGDTPPARARILLESARLLWAAGNRIPVPAVVASAPDGAWLVTARVADDRPEGPGYVAAALSAAGAFAQASRPPASILKGSRSRRAPRRTLASRLSRMRASGLSVAEFALSRRRALRLPADTLSHCDFHPDNVLYDAATGRVHVTDLECLAIAARGTDQLTLWCGLDSADDRQAVVESVLAGTDGRERKRLATLHLWLALRTLSDMAVMTGTHFDPARIEEAAQRVAEARRNADSWTR